ncbi:amidohydrolase family protein [Fodinibius sp.]|uniref:amidohydrolase family protein n=1 Tax=Fodinibius sp. TaxID=1872440 RepID=UPI00356B04A9
MLIDMNAYVGHWPFRKLNYNTCESLLGRMNQFGVDLSVISNLNGIFYQNPQSANEELYETLQSDKSFEDRFIPFAVMNPIYAGWKNDFQVCSEKMDMKGIRLYPRYHNYEITNPSCIELVKSARDRNMPVALSLRMSDSRATSWMDLERGSEWSLRDLIPLIKEVPDARYLILNIVGNPFLDEEETELLKKTNLVMDTSGRGLRRFAELLERYGRDKFAFGTHSPILDYVTGALRIESLRDSEADNKTKNLLRDGNAKRILNI